MQGPGGQTLASSGSDDGHGGITVVRVENDGTASLVLEGSEKDVLYAVSALDVSHSGEHVAVGDLDDKAIKILTYPELGFSSIASNPVTQPRAVAFSPDDSKM